MAESLFLLIGGIVAGMLGGFLGIGGGIVLMPILRFVFHLPPMMAAGTCILAVFFTTLGGSYRYYKLGYIKLGPVVPVMLSGLLASAFFSMVFILITSKQYWLDLGVGSVFFLISLRMLVEGARRLKGGEEEERAGETERGGRFAHKIAIGLGSGALPGLLGIGTGAVLVPAFVFVLSTPIKVAMASSLVCFSVNALVSSVFKFAQGVIAFDIAVPACMGTLIGANLGALLNSRTPSFWLRIFFGLVFLIVAMKFFFSFYGATAG